MLRRLLILIATLACSASLQAADFVVAVRSDSEIGALERNDVINIFFGRSLKLQNGRQAEPLDLPRQSEEREYFYQRLIGKTQSEVNAYWARLLFTGRIVPPRNTGSQEQMIETLLANPMAIGYLERSKMHRRLRIVYELTGP